jgi:hypothetical protein
VRVWRLRFPPASVDPCLSVLLPLLPSLGPPLLSSLVCACCPSLLSPPLGHSLLHPLFFPMPEQTGLCSRRDSVLQDPPVILEWFSRMEQAGMG